MSDQFIDFEDEFPTDPITLDDENLGHVEYYLRTMDQGVACVPYEGGVIVVYVSDDGAKIVHMMTSIYGEHFRPVVVPQALLEKVPTITQTNELSDTEVMDVYLFSDEQLPLVYWEHQHEIMIRERKAAATAEFVMGLHQRVGAQSEVRKLDDLAVQMILDFV
jgi:hypothetical protein